MLRLSWLLVAFAALISVYCGPTPEAIEVLEWLSSTISTSEPPTTSWPISSSTDSPTDSSPLFKSFEILKTTSPIFSTNRVIEASSSNSEEDADLGESLFLTPLIEAGNVSIVQRLAHVPFTDYLNITSYSGFLTVNKTFNSNHFFWYFPPTAAYDETAPVVLWLQGGPGESSLYGLLKEHGPIFYTDDMGFQIREHHWALNQHMIYIDNPVGTGYSFTEDHSGYCTNEEQIGEELYSSVVQFLQLFPELQQNEFYIAGESYAGKYIPALGYTIHKKNQDAELKVNLKGMAIGSGLCDPEHQIGFSEHAYQAGLIDWRTKEEGNQLENEAVRYIKHKNWEDATFMYYTARYNGLTGLSPYNYVSNPGTSPISFLAVDKPPFSDSEFRRDIHVGNRTFSRHNDMVVAKLEEDTVKSVAPWISELLSHYRMLFYNGQFDLVIPYTVTVNFLRNLYFSSAEKYKTAERNIWYVDGEVAGYYKTAGNLTEVLVRNAGHMVPEDQPKWALRLIEIFTHGTDATWDDDDSSESKGIYEKHNLTAHDFSDYA